MTKGKTKKKSSFKAGMYLLENLTSGMYNDPLSIYREYIQNAVDSIDVSFSANNNCPREVHISIDPFKKQITIRDNGEGIPSAIAEEVLSSIGSSNKNNSTLRGFRGIGRLGGIAFSDKAIFRTKAAGEKIESVQTWDCIKLRQLISANKNSLSFKDFFDTVTDFSHQNGKQPKESYFEVTLEGVSSFRNHIADIKVINNYLSQVAPVPFNYKDFSHGRTIDNYLYEKINSYRPYNIILNGNKIYKPYQDDIKISMKKSGTDKIVEVRTFEIRKGNEEPIAYGWYGLRKDLLGSIKRGEAYSGIRVRVGNILIGDGHLLDRCFREDRFNGYMIGEIHVSSFNLIPNSRRDDFIDNETKTLFYNSIEKEVGLPISKHIRLTSRSVSKEVKFEEPESLKVDIDRDKSLEKDKSNIKLINIEQPDILESIKSLCGDCPKCINVSKIIKNINF
jgi:molecular chaperone HtpG